MRERPLCFRVGRTFFVWYAHSFLTINIHKWSQMYVLHTISTLYNKCMPPHRSLFLLCSSSRKDPVSSCLHHARMPCSAAGCDRNDMLTSRAPSFCPRRLCQPGPELMCCCACTGTRPDAAKVPKLGDGLTDRLALRMTESCLYTHTHCCLVEALVVGKTVNKTHSTAWSCHHTC